ncbi:MAG: hypothetical protein FWD94_04350 [Treponema sp.]|nr:hypothetical protein [Treponema sp.]
MKRLPHVGVLAMLLFGAFCLASCRQEDGAALQRVDLFSLDIGPAEDQLSLFDFPDDPVLPRAGIAMRDGLFYISDGGGRKLARYNSFGDLLFLVFNDRTNPVPGDLRVREMDEDGQMTRWAYTFPFRSPGLIVVDSRRDIFVEEILPEEQWVTDPETRALHDGVVLRFDPDGRFLGHIGQGGPGGGPFPRIMGLAGSVDDEVAVLCRPAEGDWEIFWFNDRGEQLFLVRVLKENIPPAPGFPDSFGSIDAVIPAPDERRLYVKVDYYREIVDGFSGNLLGIESLNSHVWFVDLEGGGFETSVRLPFYEFEFAERGERQTVDLPYSLLGAVRNGGLLFFTQTEGGYAVLRIGADGEGQRRGFIEVEPERVLFNSFHLSEDGVLSALLADETSVAVSWWRMEDFMND